MEMYRGEGEGEVLREERGLKRKEVIGNRQRDLPNTTMTSHLSRVSDTEIERFDPQNKGRHTCHRGCSTGQLRRT